LKLLPVELVRVGHASAAGAQVSPESLAQHISAGALQVASPQATALGLVVDC
jgi:hypothetical protein